MSDNDECFRYILPAIVNDHMYNNTDDFSATFNYYIIEMMKKKKIILLYHQVRELMNY